MGFVNVDLFESYIVPGKDGYQRSSWGSDARIETVRSLEGEVKAYTES